MPAKAKLPPLNLLLCKVNIPAKETVILAAMYCVYAYIDSPEGKAFSYQHSIPNAVTGRWAKNAVRKLSINAPVQLPIGLSIAYSLPEAHRVPLKRLLKQYSVEQIEKSFYVRETPWFGILKLPKTDRFKYEAILPSDGKAVYLGMDGSGWAKILNMKLAK